MNYCYELMVNNQRLATLNIDHELQPEFAAALVANTLRGAYGDVWMSRDPLRPVAFETNNDWHSEKIVRVRNQFNDVRTFIFKQK